MRRCGEIEMATEGDVELELETETSGPERPPEKPRKHDSGAADLERVTMWRKRRSRVRIWGRLCPSLETDGPGSKRQNRSGRRNWRRSGSRRKIWS
ncbi:huntingtin-interacting protein K isoform X2 [Sigmodon hispidus]